MRPFTPPPMTRTVGDCVVGYFCVKDSRDQFSPRISEWSSIGAILNMIVEGAGLFVFERMLRSIP